MCEDGINTGQMKFAVAMVDETLALSQKHLGQLRTLADQGHRGASSSELAEASSLLDAARRKLDPAVEQLAHSHHHDVTVERL